MKRRKEEKEKKTKQKIQNEQTNFEKKSRETKFKKDELSACMWFTVKKKKKFLFPRSLRFSVFMGFI